MSFALLSWTPMARAMTAWQCSLCTQAQYDSLAQSKAPTTTTPIYIYDFPNNHFKKYAVDREPRLGGGYDYFAIPLTPPASEQQWFDTARNTWALNGQNANALKYQVSMSIDDMPTVPTGTRNSDAYDIVGTSSRQYDIMTCIMRGCYVGGGINPTVNANILELLNAAAGIIFSNNPISLKITITLHNGSQVIFDWTPPAIQPLLTFAWDANHNAIPLQASHLTNPSLPYGYIFHFDQYHNDLNSFIQLAQSYGVPVVNVGNGWTVACVTTPQGRRCEVRPN